MAKQSAWFTRIIATVAFAALAFLIVALVSSLSGCVGAPKSVQQVETMGEDEFEAWARRVEAWAGVAGYTAVKQGADAEKVMVFCGALSAVTDTTGDPLGAAASLAGLDEPIVALLVLEAQALLDARGGLPGGSRGLDLLHRIAGAVAHGAAKAAAIDTEEGG